MQLSVLKTFADAVVEKDFYIIEWEWLTSVAKPCLEKAGKH